MSYLVLSLLTRTSNPSMKTLLCNCTFLICISIVTTFYLNHVINHWIVVILLFDISVRATAPLLIR